MSKLSKACNITPKTKKEDLIYKKYGKLIIVKK
jgi:hypothetical protein